MKIDLTGAADQRLYVDCFGDFCASDPICSAHCALRLRCAIEQDQNIRLEILEDLATAEEPLIKIQ